MDTFVQQPTGCEIEPAMAQRIIALGLDAAFETFPPRDLGEPLELSMQREAEERFQRALSARTWWRLSREERSTISAIVRARNPWAYTNRDSPWLESECRNEILHVLKSARHTTW